jgi:class 3 adenylate cyclase
MARLSASERAKLPDSAFAYIDSRGKRMLPINDEAHVRNALARFDQVKFEDEAARERARKRLLNAAKKYSLVPVGFITGQLRSERQHAAAGRLEIEKERPAGESWGLGSAVAATLPTGVVTIMLTDIESSTALLRQLGDRYARLLDDARSVIRDGVLGVGGREVEVRADEFFAVFERPAPALEAAVMIQRAVRDRTWPDDLDVRVRIGIHTGDIALTDGGYIGMAVHKAARVCSAGHGGQIVVSEETTTAVGDMSTFAMQLRALGPHHLAGMAEAMLYQVEADGLLSDFPPLRS